MPGTRPILLTTLLALAAPFAATSPASATKAYTEDINEPFSNTFTNYCDVTGLTVVDAGTFQSRLRIQTRHDGLAYFLEHVTVDETVTGVASQASVTIHTAFISKDLKVTDNHNGTLTIISLLTGPSTMYGPDGKAIARDPGQVRFRTVVTDGGTPGDPSDDGFVSQELIKGSTGRSDDYCAALVPVVG